MADPLGAIALAALLCCAPADDGSIPATPPRSTSECMAAGLQWLLTHQQQDGSYGTFESSRVDEVWLDTLASHRAFRVATTALCVMALIEPSRSDEAAASALDRAVAWSLGELPVGKATGGTFYDTWAHTYLIDMGVRLLKEPRLESRHEALRALVTREIDLAMNRQAADGGWGYYDFHGTFERASGMQTTSFNTGAMTLALMSARDAGFAVPPERLATALERLRKFRLPDGAFIYGTYADLRPITGFNRPNGTSGRLQVCQLALWQGHIADVDQPKLLEGLVHLRDRHHYIEIGRGRPIPHEAFYSNSGYYYFFGHYYASRVIGSLDSATERAAFGAWLDDLLRRVQNSDGSWFDYPLYGYGHAYATGFSMMAMQELRRIAAADAAAAAQVETPARSEAKSSQNPG